MKNIKKLISTDLTENEMDAKMSDILKDKFNQDLRAKYAKKLKEQHGITKTGITTETGQSSTQQAKQADKSKFSVAKILIPLLIIGTLLVGYNMMNQKAETTKPANTEEQVQQFFASNEVNYIDNTRTEGKSDKARTAAIELFQQKKYRKAGETFTEVDPTRKTVQDNYYQAYSQLRAGQSMDAALGFGKVLRATNEGENYHPEAQLYQIISFIALKDFAKAKTLYGELKENSWAHKKLSSIIQGLDKN